MCGFVMAVGDEVQKEWIRNGIISLQHRGPDYTGYYQSNDLQCAHARLAIIDLDNRSNQPMVTENGVTLLFNGEIYNYKDLKSQLELEGVKFTTLSDTEVILKGFLKHGKKFIKNLNGQFSIALVDKRNIYLFRDLAGQKPLYYYVTNKTIYIASELSAFYSFNLKMNLKFYSDYLINGFSDVSPFQGVVKVKQGSSVIFDRNSVKLIEDSKFFKYSLSSIYESLSQKEIKNKLHSLLKASIERHCEADVPIGLLLSGGIDSSVVASMIPNNMNITCFTVDFGDNCDEIRNAKAIARNFNLKLEILSIRRDIDFKEYVRIISTMKEPIGDSSYLAVYLITKRIKELGIKVVLTGDGADELFAGYSLYKYLRIVYKLPYKLSKALVAVIRKFNFKSRSILKWSAACEDLNQGLHPNPRAFFNNLEIQDELHGYESKSPKIFKNKFLLKRLIKDDLSNYLSNGLLFKNDCASMSNSIELRSPFLDMTLVNFSLKYLSEKHLLNNNKSKSLLIDIAKSQFPKDYSFNRKRGFNFAESIITESFLNEALDFLKKNPCIDEKIKSHLIEASKGNIWEFYRFHIRFVYKIWRMKVTHNLN